MKIEHFAIQTEQEAKQFDLAFDDKKFEQFFVVQELFILVITVAWRSSRFSLLDSVHFVLHQSDHLDNLRV